MSQVDLPLQGAPPRPSRPTGELAARRRALHPLAPAFAAVYLTFGTLLLVDPQPVLDWLDDRDPSPLVSAARSSVEAVAAASNALGLAQLSAAARDWTAPLFRRPGSRPS